MKSMFCASLRLVAVMSISALATPADFRPGWGFLERANGSGLGYPSLPWQTWNLAASTSLYFVGNDTGMNSILEIISEAKFGVVGMGWQIAMHEKNWQHLESLERETAIALKKANPSVKVLASRNTEVLTSVWDATRSLMLSPGPEENPNLFIRAPEGATSCERPLASEDAQDPVSLEASMRPGETSIPMLAPPLGNQSRMLCNGSWSCDHCGRPPATTEVPYGKVYWNWTDPDMPDIWLNRHALTPIVDACKVEVVGRDGKSSVPCIDGVYWDCSCGTVGVPSGDMPAFMGAAQAGFDSHLPVVRALGKATIAWAGESISAKTCSQDMQRLREAYGPLSPLYNDTTLQLRWDLNPATFNLTLQAFQVLRPASALLMFQVEGAYECASGPCGTGQSSGYTWPSQLDEDWGVPLEPAGGRLVAPGVWERRWSQGVARVDCNQHEAEAQRRR